MRREPAGETVLFSLAWAVYTRDKLKKELDASARAKTASARVSQTGSDRGKSANSAQERERDDDRIAKRIVTLGGAEMQET